ncbi:MAG: conjugal transfer protein [Pedosphaera sp.]|nr:conjugal transfer protein [Pedosphaera sp.]
MSNLKAASDTRDYVRSEFAPGNITLWGILDREWEIVCMAKEGEWKYDAINPDYEISSGLMLDQQAATERILRSEDFVTLFCRGAGTGRSHTLREIGKGLMEAKHAVVVIAPQRQQALDLKRSFGQTQTVSEFVTKRDMPDGGGVSASPPGAFTGTRPVPAGR